MTRETKSAGQYLDDLETKLAEEYGFDEREGRWLINQLRTSWGREERLLKERRERAKAVQS